MANTRTTAPRLTPPAPGPSPADITALVAQATAMHLVEAMNHVTASIPGQVRDWAQARIDAYGAESLTGQVCTQLLAELDRA